MKNNIFIQFIIFTLLAIFTTPGISQQPMGGGRHQSEEHQERIRSMKVAFITEHLSLTSEEAQRFWPVYNQYEKEMNELRAKHSREMQQEKSVSELTDQEASRYAESEVRRVEETAELKRKYHEKYLKVLSVRKVALLYEAEKEFNRRLFREMRRRQRDAK